MSLLDALLLDPAPFNVWIAVRSDGIKGSGTASAEWPPKVIFMRPSCLLLVLAATFEWIAVGQNGVTNYVTSAADSGPGSLRQAILDCNAAGGGAIQISNDMEELQVSNSLPAITADLKIRGAGTNLPWVRQVGAPRTLLFQIVGPSVVTVSGLRFSQAFLDIENAGDFQVANCAVDGSLSISNRGTLLVRGCQLEGDIWLYNLGSVAIRNCSKTRSGTQLNVAGKGVTSVSSLTFAGIGLTNGTLRLFECTSSNRHIWGRNGSETCTYCPVCPPYYQICLVTPPQDASGGGVRVIGGTLEMLGCTISGNSARGGDATSAELGHYATNPGMGRGGGIYVINGALRMTNCTVSDNAVMGGGGRYATRQFTGNGHGFGGGICMISSTGVFVNCTVSGNRATGGSAVSLSGGIGVGGVYVDRGAVSLFNCTITGNVGTGGAAGGLTPYGWTSAGYGSGGLVNGTVSNSLTIGNTIIAGNSGSQPVIGTSSSIVVVSELLSATNNPIVSEGGNLFGQTNNLSGLVVSDLQNAAPLLGPLQDNGGPVFTHALLAGSPAIDAGTSSGTGFDARGQPRTIDHLAVPNAPGSDGTDIGALEVDPVLRSTEVYRSGDDVLVRFTSVSDKTYGVEFKPELSGQTWTALDGRIQGTAGNATFTDQGAAKVSRRFYRVFEVGP